MISLSASIWCTFLFFDPFNFLKYVKTYIILSKLTYKQQHNLN